MQASSVNHWLSLGFLMDNLSTPVFRAQVLTSGRVLHQDPILYRAIQFENPFFPEVLRQMQLSFDELHTVVEQGQRGVAAGVRSAGALAGVVADCDTDFVDLFGAAGDFMGERFRRRGHEAIGVFNVMEKDMPEK